MRYIYADNAATTQLSPVALEAMMPYLTDRIGNPGGIHRLAKQAAKDLAQTRAHVAELLGASSPREIIFTSGGSESNNLILQGAVRAFRAQWGSKVPVRIITSQFEHHSVLHTCAALEHDGVEVTYLPVDSQGFVNPSDLERALESSRSSSLVAGTATPATVLVSIMLANNEVGTLQNISELTAIAHEFGSPFHTDAVQAVGHTPIKVIDLDVDALSFSAHKFHGPRGVGATYIKTGFAISPLIHGGGQELGLRAGTENLAGAVGLAAALDEALDDLPVRCSALHAHREELTQAILGSISDVISTGPRNKYDRLPSIASFICKNIDGELLTVILDKAGVAASTGSACTAGSTDPSHVLRAMGFTDPAWAKGTLRLSLADDIAQEDIDLLKERVPQAITQARLLSGMQ